MKFRAEFTTTPDRGARIAQRAALAGDLVHVTTDNGETRVAVQYEAPDNYTAASLALVMQGALPVAARVRRDSVMLPGRWFDLNEE